MVALNSMEKKRFQTPHFGGPIGLAGLAVLAGATGIVVLSPDAAETPARATKDVEMRDVDVAVTAPEGNVEDAGEGRVETESSVAITEPVLKPAKQDTVEVKPAAAQRGAEVTYIVRIKGVPEIDEAARLYRRDYAGAQKTYRAYQAKTPALENFRLVGSSYSGEVKLAYDLAPGVEPSRDVVQSIQDKLTTIDGFSYADPDYIAHPGKGD